MVYLLLFFQLWHCRSMNDSATSASELQALAAKVEAENQLLRVKNAHLLNLLTESCSNCQSLATTLHTLDQQVKAKNSVG